MTYNLVYTKNIDSDIEFPTIAIIVIIAISRIYTHNNSAQHI